MISFNIIMNYYSNLTSEFLFQSFMQTNDYLFTKYNIDRAPIKEITLESQYEYLYRSVVEKTNYEVQFNNQWIVDSFKVLTTIHHINARIVDIKKEAEEITHILIQEDACLSLSLHGKLGWHVTPIGYHSEFFTVNQGDYYLLGQDFMNIKEIGNADDIGDGILFQKRQGTIE